MASKTGFKMYSCDEVLGQRVYRAAKATPPDERLLTTITNQYYWKYSNPDKPVVIARQGNEYSVMFTNGTSEKLDRVFIDNKWSPVDIEPEPLRCPSLSDLCARIIIWLIYKVDGE